MLGTVIASSNLMPSVGMKYAAANAMPGYGTRIAIAPICALFELNLVSGSPLSYLLNMISSFHEVGMCNLCANKKYSQ